jgi:hypothetical protein
MPLVSEEVRPLSLTLLTDILHTYVTHTHKNLIDTTALIKFRNQRNASCSTCLYLLLHPHFLCYTHPVTTLCDTMLFAGNMAAVSLRKQYCYHLYANSPTMLR